MSLPQTVINMMDKFPGLRGAVNATYQNPDRSFKPQDPPPRVPVNPEIGEYYAAIRIPDTANLGLYRIRWFFKEFINGPQNIVVQEFEVQTPGQGTFPNSQYSQKISSLIRSLR